MSEITRVGVDLAQALIQVHAVNAGGKLVTNRQLNLDLREICTDPADYSTLSPIEPSVAGGAKISGRLVSIIQSHPFGHPESMIYR